MPVVTLTDEEARELKILWEQRLTADARYLHVGQEFDLMRNTQAIQTKVDSLISSNEVGLMLRRTQMMIFNYRTRKDDPLPAVQKDDRIVGYVKSDVIAWARRNNIHVTGD